MHDEITLIPLSPFLAMIAETGELIPAFAGGMGGNDPAPIPETPVVPEASPEEKALYAKQAEAAARDAGFLVNAPDANILRLAPPLVLTDEQAQSFIDALPAILDTAQGEKS